MSETAETPETPETPEKSPRVSRPTVLRRLTRLYDNPRYLEVGVRKGITFDRVPAHRKVAVDPVFAFDHEEMAREHPEAAYHQVTSDEYFATLVGADEQFDVIYLDGLHVYEQTLRDLMNALHHLQPQGVIVIDDTRPPSYLASLTERESFFTVKKYLESPDPRWMGDVFKLVWFIETFCPHLTYRTIADNHGQTVVWRKRRSDYPQRTLAQIADLSFEDMVLDEQVLQLRPYAEIRRELRADLGL